VSRPLRVAVWVAQGLLIFWAGFALAQGATAVFGHHAPAEDDPGWDCATMGNHQCGPAPRCLGDTPTAPCAVVIRDDGSAVEWSTHLGD
jgi:hypothetical protein